jgi:Lrp/AsnC family leucine-responsive transcriptional regulator
MTIVLDDTDRKILTLLQENAHLTNAALGEAVGLSAPSVFERIRKLEQRGVIRGYKAQVDATAIGRPLTAFIRLTLAYDDKHDQGFRAISADPDVLEAYELAGEDCLIVKTRLANTDELHTLLHRIRAHVTVLRSVTMIGLQALKEDGPLNVAPASAPGALQTQMSGNGHAPRAKGKGV